MSASVVIGQANFTSAVDGSISPSASSLSHPYHAIVIQGKLVVVDNGNNRVLIFNSVPTTNNASADVVIGQPNMTSGSANQGGSAGANTLDYPSKLATDGTKLFVTDNHNHRVLIFNTVPTSNNTSADVVIGQPDMTTVSTSPTADKMNDPCGVDYDSTTRKLIVTEYGHSRALIFNSVPITNGVSADVVIGQADFTSTSPNQGGSPASNSLNGTCGSRIIQGKIVIPEYGNNRILIFNGIPTSNNASADVVIGQTNFSNNSANQGGSAGANTLNTPTEAVFDGKRLLISDKVNNRVLLFNGIPSSNNTSAYMVIGQSNFTSTSVNQGGVPGANTLNGSDFDLGNMSLYSAKLFLADTSNNRVLIYNNIENNPGISLNNSPEGRDNNLFRLKGTVTIPSDSLYSISNVEYSVNGGGFSGATATDGSFSSTTEEFYFDFDPKSNQQKDSQGNLIDGYTVRVKSTNSNLDVTDNLFYFSPFNVNEPLDNAVSSSTSPSFDFSVIKQKSILKDNLSKYQIQARLGGSSSTASWETIIDDIPIDGTLDNTGTVVVDNNNFKAVYSDDSSRIKVTSKKKTLAGSMQWKVVAVDKSGHTQDSNSRSLRINTKNSVTTSNFPLAILNISGLGNPHISTTNLSAIKDTYYLGSLTPIFYGIATTNAKVTLSLTDQSCDTTKSTDCIKTYSTTANQDSRYGINIPKGDLKWGKKYTTNMSIAYNQDYNELPEFILSISGSNLKSITTKESVKGTSAQINPTPNPTPTPKPLGGQQETPKKKCFLFWCF